MEQTLMNIGTGILTKRQKEKLIEKEDYEEREKIRRLNNSDKKVIVKIKYGTTTNWKTGKDEKDFFITDNRKDVGIVSYIGGVHSSAFRDLSFDEAEKEALDWLIKGIVEDGVKQENINIIKE